METDCIFCDRALVEADARTIVIHGQPALCHAFHIERRKPTHPFRASKYNPDVCDACVVRREDHAA